MPLETHKLSDESNQINGSDVNKLKYIINNPLCREKLTDQLSKNDGLSSCLQKLNVETDPESLVENTISYNKDKQNLGTRGAQLPIKISSTAENVPPQSLSDETISQLCAGRDFKQGPVGNCYAVADLQNLSDAPGFPALIKKNLKIGKKNGNPVLYMKYPLIGGPKKTVEIPSLISSITGGSGIYRILETLFNRTRGDKNRNGSLDLDDITGGLPGELVARLLYGKRKPGLTGNPKISPYNLTSYEAHAQSLLKDFDPDRHFLSIASLIRRQPGSGGIVEKAYKVENGQTMYSNHAYHIKSVGKDSAGNITSVTLINPRKKNAPGGTSVTLSYQGFLNSTSMIGGTITDSPLGANE